MTETDTLASELEQLREAATFLMYAARPEDCMKAMKSLAGHLDEHWDTILAALNRRHEPADGLERVRSEFLPAILHGDEAHRAWLREAVDCFLADKPVPPPTGKGTQPPADATDAEGTPTQSDAEVERLLREAPGHVLGLVGAFRLANNGPDAINESALPAIGDAVAWAQRIAALRAGASQ